MQGKAASAAFFLPVNLCNAAGLFIVAAELRQASLMQ